MPQTWRAREMWASRMAMGDVFARLGAHATAAGVSPGAARGFGTLAYMANASAYPQVERHFRYHRGDLARMAAAFDTVMEPRVRARMLEAGFNDAYASEFARGVARGTRERYAQIPRTVAKVEEANDAILALHGYLVRIDDRVDYDSAGDRLVFARQSELDHTNELIARMRRLMTEVKAIQATNGTDVPGALEPMADSI